MADDNIIFKKLDDLRQREPDVLITDAEREEIQEIDQLRKIVMDVQSVPGWTYHTST